MVKSIVNAFDHTEFCLVLTITDGKWTDNGYIGKTVKQSTACYFMASPDTYVAARQCGLLSILHGTSGNPVTPGSYYRQKRTYTTKKNRKEHWSQWLKLTYFTGVSSKTNILGSKNQSENLMQK